MPFLPPNQQRQSTEGGTTLLLYFAFALVHDSRGIEIVNFTISLALSAGTLMASAGTPYHLVPAHFYPCLASNHATTNSCQFDAAADGYNEDDDDYTASCDENTVC